MKSAVPIDKRIFWPALICVVTVVLLLGRFPDQSKEVLDKVLEFMKFNFGFIYLWFTVFCLALLLWFAYGRYGKLKFGDPEDQPEFSTLSWIGMLFCAGIGTSLMYWATIEWADYYNAPPFGIEPKSAEAAHWAAMYGLFHWGPFAWALYCVPALPIAYAFHNRKIPCLRVSAACRGVIGDHADGLLGKVIDILFILGLVGGTGTSLGLGTPILSETIGALFGIERTFGSEFISGFLGDKVPDTFCLDAIVIIIWTAMFATTVYLGLEKGIKRLADANVYLGFVLCAFVLVFGPTLFIIDTFTNSVGLLATNFVRMAFYTDPVGKSGFPQDWTVFYWAWWIAYAPFMGLFVAKISKGRTIREVVRANLVFGTLGCWMFFALFGNTALYCELNDVVPVTKVMEESSKQAAIVAVVSALPMKWTPLFLKPAVTILILIMFLAMCFIYSATTLQASAYIIAAVASRDLKGGDGEPARWNRLFWALALGGMAIALMYLGGLPPLQTISLVVAFPLVFIILLSVWSLLRWLKEDFPEGTPVNPGDEPKK